MTSCSIEKSICFIRIQKVVNRVFKGCPDVLRMYYVHVAARVSVRVLESARVVCACERAGCHMGARVVAHVSVQVANG